MKYENNLKKNFGFSNKGMGLESDINLSNTYYLNKNIAIIHKKPTPIKPVKVSSNTLGKTIITQAYYEMPSTTDYNGIYKGMYIDFEAKETNNKTSFPLSNIHEHQIKHLINVKDHGGVSFIIVRFNCLNKTYLLFCKEFQEFITQEKRKSIPIKYFEENGFIIKNKFNPRIDYIDIIKNIYLGGK